MKFVFYIIDIDEGTIEGTNDVEVAERFIENNHHIILHPGGTYFAGSREERDVKDITKEENDDYDDNDFACI